MPKTDHVGRKNELIRSARAAKTITWLFSSALLAVFGWLKLNGIDFGPLKQNLSADLIFKLTFVLYFAAWTVGLPWDTDEQELVYVQSPKPRKVIMAGLAAGLSLTVVFGLMLWVDSYAAFAVLLAVFWILNVVSWRYLIKRALPETVAASRAYYRDQKSFAGLEQLRLVFDGYLAGTWQWQRFAAGAVIIVALNLLCFTRLGGGLARLLDWSEQMVQAVTTLAYVLVMEIWIWTIRVRVRARLSLLENLGSTYDFTPYTTHGGRQHR